MTLKVTSRRPILPGAYTRFEIARRMEFWGLTTRTSYTGRPPMPFNPNRDIPMGDPFWTIYGRLPADADGLEEAHAIMDLRGDLYPDDVKAEAQRIADGRLVTFEPGALHEVVYEKADLMTPEVLADAAMCLWEVVHCPLDPFKPVKGWEDRKWWEGWAAFRDKVREEFAPVAHAAWVLATDAGYCDGAFDWEFCPWFMADCIDWDTGAVRDDWAERAETLGDDEGEKETAALREREREAASGVGEPTVSPMAAGLT